VNKIGDPVDNVAAPVDATGRDPLVVQRRWFDADPAHRF
jgi:hypothetical protein